MSGRRPPQGALLLAERLRELVLLRAYGGAAWPASREPLEEGLRFLLGMPAGDVQQVSDLVQLALRLRDREWLEGLDPADAHRISWVYSNCVLSNPDHRPGGAVAALLARKRERIQELEEAVRRWLRAEGNEPEEFVAASAALRRVVR